MPQSYIDQLKPVAIVMSANHITMANGATFPTDNSAQHSAPSVSLGLIDSAGTETITTSKMKLKNAVIQMDRYRSNRYEI